MIRSWFATLISDEVAAVRMLLNDAERERDRLETECSDLNDECNRLAIQLTTAETRNAELMRTLYTDQAET